MAFRKNILVAVDPSREKQPALELAASVTSLNFEGHTPKIYMLLGIDADKRDTSATNPAMYRNKAYFEELLKAFDDAGLEADARISWSSDWADSLMHTATEEDADMILISNPGSEGGREFSDQFWYLLRNSSVPIGLISTPIVPDPNRILLAMDLREAIREEQLSGLNARMLETGKTMEQAYRGELHLAYAYGSSVDHPDRGRLIKALDMPNENLHLAQGDADQALQQTFEKVDPHTVIVGATRRTGIRAALRGRKLAEIIRKVKHNIFFVV